MHIIHYPHQTGPEDDGIVGVSAHSELLQSRLACRAPMYFFGGRSCYATLLKLQMLREAMASDDRVSCRRSGD